jgi:hypothetical protein
VSCCLEYPHNRNFTDHFILPCNVTGQVFISKVQCLNCDVKTLEASKKTQVTDCRNLWEKIVQQNELIYSWNRESMYALCTKVKNTEYKCPQYEIPLIIMLVHVPLEIQIFSSALCSSFLRYLLFSQSYRWSFVSETRRAYHHILKNFSFQGWTTSNAENYSTFRQIPYLLE